MKNNQFITEMIISAVLIVLVVALLNPFGWWMPDMMAMTIMLVLIVVFAVFASFVWQEKARDERELLHKMVAGRLAFLVGSAVLVIGIVVESFSHEIDQWLVVTLTAMILAKLFGLIYSRTKN